MIHNQDVKENVSCIWDIKVACAVTQNAWQWPKFWVTSTNI